MARFEAGHAKAGINTANSAMWALRTASTRDIYVSEIGLFVEVAPTTGPAFRLVRATAVGTSSATVTPQSANGTSPAATALLDTAWSVQPTAAAVDLRRCALPASIGGGIIWSWPDKVLFVPASSSLLLVNANATGTTLGTFSIYVAYEE